MPVSYILDSNCFIQSKNFHYQFRFAKCFWTWIEEAHGGEMLYSIKKVKKELSRHPDELHNWAVGMPDNFFLSDTEDPEVMTIFGDLINKVEQKSQYTAKAKRVFSDSNRADAFLIAVAKRYGATLITNEVRAPESQKSVKIPDAAEMMGVKTKSLYDALGELAEHNFKFKTNQ
jgi:hypothetical protein